MGAGGDGSCYQESSIPVKPARNGVFRDGPVYKHDCENCVYLLTYAFRGREVDVYACGSAILGGKVFRFSDEPSDNTTMVESVIVRLGLNLDGANELISLAGAKTVRDMFGDGGTLVVVRP